MANLKRFYVSGQIPFDLPCNSTERVARFFASLNSLNSPVSGLQITYGKETYVPNEQGGKTSMFEFCISGEEALNWKFTDLVLKEMKENGAIIQKCSIIDIEQGNNIYCVK